MFNRTRKKVKTKKEVAEFEALLKPVYSELFRFIFAMTKNKVLTDDVMQNTLVKAYESFYQLKDKEKFKSWIYTIAKNETLNAFRKFSRCKETATEDDVLYNISIHQDTMEEIMIREETKNQLGTIINQLKKEYKEVIILYYYYDLTLEEISDILGSNASTIRTRHARAKKCIYDSLIREESPKKEVNL
ncbi:RNA polymerase sigma factor [Irregularibacter muris]|uniref:RNA polymerase sigma factor n=1 Tax=Irregularibacter muris TaxID=1796619 RepID=A0AAE3HEL1_9FIRM|nr:RNA polymerase sigma factor [Irregularibacter muris]MCR1899067.1 RNA polymerase sigma factor [Irregularibacter muris]